MEKPVKEFLHPADWLSTRATAYRIHFLLGPTHRNDKICAHIPEHPTQQREKEHRCP